jgi:hypothetical protein
VLVGSGSVVSSTAPWSHPIHATSGSVAVVSGPPWCGCLWRVQSGTGFGFGGGGVSGGLGSVIRLSLLSNWKCLHFHVSLSACR